MKDDGEGWGTNYQHTTEQHFGLHGIAVKIPF
jgi:hypothetical protein